MSILSIKNSALLTSNLCHNITIRSYESSWTENPLTIRYVDWTGAEVTTTLTEATGTGSGVNFFWVIPAKYIIDYGQLFYVSKEVVACPAGVPDANYSVIIDNYSCSGTGDSPTNFSVGCSGNKTFTMTSAVNSNDGVFRYTGLNTDNGVQIDTTPSISYPMSQTITATGIYSNGNSPDYPYAHGSSSGLFHFEHSVDGGITWTPFRLVISGSA